MARNDTRDGDDDADEPRPRKSKKRRPSEDDAPTAKKAPSPLWAIVILVPLIGLAVFMAIWQVRSRSAEQSAFWAEMDTGRTPGGRPRQGRARQGGHHRRR